MSPMILAAFLYMIIALLWWSGWQAEIAGQLPRTAVTIFLLGWLPAAVIPVPITAGLTISGAWLLTIAAMLLLAWRTEASRRWIAFSAGFLLGALLIMLEQIAQLPTDITTYLSPVWAAVILGVLAALLLGDAAMQFLAITFAVLLSATVMSVFAIKFGQRADGETLEWLACWLLSAVTARVASVLFQFKSHHRQHE